MKRAILVLSALLSFWTTGQVNGGPINPAVEYSTSSTLIDSRPFTLGYLFNTSVTLNVNALGYWVDGQANNHQVGIWNSTGTLLASTTVLSTDVVQGHFQWHSIPNLILGPGNYTIGGEFLGHDDPFPYQATGVVTIPGYTWVTDEQLFGSGLNFPTVSTGGSYGQNGILAADFSIAPTASGVPEPSSLALFGMATATFAGYFGWRRPKQAVVA